MFVIDCITWVLCHQYKQTQQKFLSGISDRFAASVRLSVKQYIWFTNQDICESRFVSPISAILSHKALRENWSFELFLNASQTQKALNWIGKTAASIGGIASKAAKGDLGGAISDTGKMIGSWFGG